MRKYHETVKFTGLWQGDGTTTGGEFDTEVQGEGNDEQAHSLWTYRKNSPAEIVEMANKALP